MNCFSHNLIWAIAPEHVSRLSALLQKDEHEVAKESKLSDASYTKADKVAILPLHGVIFQHPNFYTKYGFGTDTDTFGKWFDAMVADKSIAKIIIDIDSPGGSVYGTKELSDKIYAARGTKPIVAVANSLMASAAYHIGSAADRIYATPGGDVGSIGVLAVHSEFSQLEEKAGIKTTIVRRPEYKAEANSSEPLTEEAREALQKSVDDSYDLFVSSVARNRGVAKSVVKSGYGQGRLLVSRDALAAGMIDGIKTLEEVLDIRQFRGLGKSKAQAEIELMKRK